MTGWTMDAYSERKPFFWKLQVDVYFIQIQKGKERHYTSEMWRKWACQNK